MSSKESDDLSKVEKAKLTYNRIGQSNKQLDRENKRQENKHPKLKSASQKSPITKKASSINKTRSAKVGNAAERITKSLEKMSINCAIIDPGKDKK